MSDLIRHAPRTAAGAALGAACLSFVSAAVVAATTPVAIEPFTFPQPSGFSESAQAADLNGDGKLDIVVGMNFDSPIVYLNNGTDEPFEGVVGQAITPHPPNSQPTDPQQEAYIVDLNGDQRPDILAVGFNSPTKLYLNNGTANPFAGVVGLDINPGSTDSSTEAAVADYNGDGRPDIALSNTNHSPSRVFLNTGAAPNPFAGSTRLDVGVESAYADHVQAGDVNGDGRPDIVLTFGEVTTTDPSGVFLYLNNGTGNPFNGVTPKIMAGGNAWITKLADVNADSRLDLIVGGVGDANFVALNSGSATDPFPTKVEVRPTQASTGCPAIHTSDIDANGTVDLVFGCLRDWMAGPVTSVAVFFRGNGTSNPFSGAAAEEAVLNAPFSFTRSLVVTDLAAGGRLDLLFAGGPVISYTLFLDQNPVAQDDSGVASVNQFINKDVLANDTDADGTIVRSTLEIVAAPLHGIARIDPATRAIIFQPDPGFSGTDSLRYRVKDDLGAVSNVGTLALRIQPPPVANNDAQSTNVNQAVTFNVLANDTSAGGTIDPATLLITTAPTNGTASIVAGTSTINYQPNSGFVGNDTFQYTVRDNLGAVSGVAVVTVTMTNPPSRGGGGGGSQSAVVLLMLLGLGLLRSRVSKPVSD